MSPMPLWAWILGGLVLAAVVVVAVGIWCYPRDNSF